MPHGISTSLSRKRSQYAYSPDAYEQEACEQGTLEQNTYEQPGTCYRCPKCKQRVTVLVAALVVCCRCGRPMKHCQEPRARS